SARPIAWAAVAFKRNFGPRTAIRGPIRSAKCASAVIAAYVRQSMRPYRFSVQIDYSANRARRPPMKLCAGSSALHVALFFFLTAAVTFAPPPVRAAQVAATIEFDAAPRPSVVPEDMQPLPGASLKFLAIKALDGSNIDAALWQPDRVPPDGATM